MAHFGFRPRRPEDIAVALAAIRAAGGRVLDTGELVPGEPYVFFADPDGYEVEVWYELPTPVDPPEPTSTAPRSRAQAWGEGGNGRPDMERRTYLAAGRHLEAGERRMPCAPARCRSWSSRCSA